MACILKNKNIKLVFFILSFIAIEYAHEFWALTFPFFSLGYVFSKSPDFIQWYKFVGVHGGSVFALVLIVLVFKFITYLTKGVKNWYLLSSITILVLGSFFTSYISKEPVKNIPVNVKSINTSIDSKEKYDTSNEDLKKKYIQGISS